MCAPVPRVPRNSNFHKSYAATRLPGIRFLVNNYKKIASKSFPVSKFYFSNLKLNIFNLLDNQLTGIVPSAFSLSFYNSSLTGNPGLCSNDGLEGLKSCSDMEDGRRRKCKKRNDTLMTYYHKNIPNLLRWSVLIDVLLIYKITAIGPLHILKYPVKQLLRYYQAISTKISRAAFQGIKICPDSNCSGWIV